MDEVLFLLSLPVLAIIAKAIMIRIRQKNPMLFQMIGADPIISRLGR